jgi:hypothetical protein
MVFMSLRVRELKICTRPPEVTAKVSFAPVVIEVIALLCGEGTSSCDLKVRQYAWSAVRGAGPGAARTGAIGCTSAAIVCVNGFGGVWWYDHMKGVLQAWSKKNVRHTVAQV